MIPDDVIDEFARTYAQPGAMRAGLAYYRAIPQDVADNERAVAAGKLAMPVLALGGGESFGRRELTLESMRRVADDVRGGVVAGSGPRRCAISHPFSKRRRLCSRVAASAAERPGSTTQK